MLQTFTNSLKKEVCPYCFETFSFKETPFRCSSPPSMCPPELDPVLQHKWRDGAPTGRVLRSGKATRSLRCGQCRQESTTRLCPLCHMDLPRTLGETKNLIFAMIGAKAAGKSHYLAVLIEELRNRVGPALGVLLEPVNDRTIRRYRDEFYTPVYRHNRTILGTRSGIDSTPVPLIYTLSFVTKSLFGGSKIGSTVSIVFFDTAGEDLDSEDVASSVNKYIYRADGLVVLLDPLQLDSVRAQLQGTVALPEQNTETADIVSRVSNLIRRGQGTPTGALKTPVAVAFSKIDAVEPMIDPQYQLNSMSSHAGGFDLDDFTAVNGEMQALLTQWHGHGILNQVTTTYPRHGFFGLSALGCNPQGTNQIPRVLPRRVEDPFLWLLYQHGLLKPAARR